MHHAQDSTAVIRLSYEFNTDRYVRALTLYMRYRIKPALRWTIHLLALGLTAFSVTALLFYPQETILYAILPIGPLVLLRERISRWLWTRSFRSNKLCGQTIEVRVTSEGLDTSIPGLSRGTLAWSLVDAVVAKENDLLVLQSNRRIFHYLPADAYLEGDAELVLGLARERVPVLRLP